VLIYPIIRTRTRYFRHAYHPTCDSMYVCMYVCTWPITAIARSKACTVFARSDAGIVCSNPTQGMDVCVRLFCICVVLCVGSGIATG
jgi:hypothetical protein